MGNEPYGARGGFASASALTVAGIGMLFGTYLPWLSVYMLLGSSATYFSPHEVASTSTKIWHLLFGSSSPDVATYAGAVGRSAIVCSVGVIAAAALSVLIPMRYRIWVNRLAMSLAIVAMLDCVLVIAVVSSNDAEYASAVSTSYGCYFTLVASLAAMTAAYLNSPVKAAREQSPGVGVGRAGSRYLSR